MTRAVLGTTVPSQPHKGALAPQPQRDLCSVNWVSTNAAALGKGPVPPGALPAPGKTEPAQAQRDAVIGYEGGGGGGGGLGHVGGDGDTATDRLRRHH